MDEQERRFEARMKDPLRQWKLSRPAILSEAAATQQRGLRFATTSSVC